jgi:hypothetical protein
MVRSPDDSADTVREEDEIVRKKDDHCEVVR